ncbi:MAG: hypothetical protein KBS96_08350 [Lachnospiraceae bacterium]|nr:hypothetical protein [Candidatus Colinaster scatohippi]
MEHIKRTDAFELLKKYNKDSFHIQHALTVEAVMKWYAAELGYAEDAEYWGIVGLLHDIDFEEYPNEHCLKAPELLKEAGVGEDIIHAVCSHGYGITVGCGETIDVEPVHEMEKVLFAADELTGLIWSASLMRPSKSTKDMELKSLKKKYKSTGFAAGCDRGVIARGAEMLDWELDKLLDMTLKAMAASEDSINAQMEAEFPKTEEESKYLVNEAGYAIDPLFESQVDFDTFSKSDFRVVKVKACEAVAKSKKLLHFTLDDGTGVDRTILSGIHAFYEPEELVGKTLLAITNLPPRPMMGIDSCGMLLSAIHYVDGEEKLNLVMLDDSIPAGAKLY